MKADPGKVQAPQRTKPAAGSAARSLQRACSGCGKYTHGGGECEDCKNSRQPRKASLHPDGSKNLPAAQTPAPMPSGGFSLLSVPVQAKLSISQPGDPFEQEADRVAEMVTGAGASAPPTITAHLPGSAWLRNLSPSPADSATSASGPQAPGLVEGMLPASTSSGQPLPLPLRSLMERRFGANFSSVRLHTDAEAARMSEAINARAFTHGRHIYFGPGAFEPRSQAGHRLLAHELAHTVQQGSAPGPVLWRQPKVQVTLGEPEINPVDASQQQVEEWRRLQVNAASMDQAALNLAHSPFITAIKANFVFIGLSSDFIKFYDKDGRPLGQAPLKKAEKLHFIPGVYVKSPSGNNVVALTSSSFDPNKIRIETSGYSAAVEHPLTAKQKEEVALAQKEKRPPNIPPPPPLDLEKVAEDPAKLHAILDTLHNVVPVYFVPTYPSGKGGKAGGKTPSLYASPIESRGDGKAANAQPWPVDVEGPRLAPIDSDPTYSARVHWEANGNTNLASQVITQVGSNIHYRWERFDITQYAEKEIAKDPAGVKATEAAEEKPEKSLEQRVEDFKKSKVGSGENVTGMGGAKREFSREFENWWKDTKRASKGYHDPQGDTVGEKLSHAAANRLSLELAPVSLLTTAIGATFRLIADLFAGPRKQQEIPLEKKGYYLIRVITTPAIQEDTKGNEVIRPPSVAARIVEVTPIETAVRKALDEPADQIGELEAQIKEAKEAKNEPRVAYLSNLLAEAKLRYQGSALALLKKQHDEKEQELKEFRKNYPSLSDYTRRREVENLETQIAKYEEHEAQVTPGGGALKRVNATLISEVTAEQYPLLLSAGPMAKEDGQFRWLVSDVTNPSGEAFIGKATTSSEAFHKAMKELGGKAAYGRGLIGVQTAGLGLEEGAPKDFMIESVETDWNLAEKRIEDLVTTLVTLGLVVSTAGTAGAIIGAGLAAARLINRWRAGNLSLNDQTVSDALGLLGGIGAAGQLGTGVLRGLRIQRFEKYFAVIQDGRAAEAEISAAAKALTAVKSAEQLARAVELANEAINYAGLVWGNVTFLDTVMSINFQEREGLITHAAARKARAAALSSAVQNNGFFLAGNVAKGKAKAKEAAREPAGIPTEKKPAATEKVQEQTIPPDEIGRPGEKQRAPDDQKREEQAVREEGNKPAQRVGEPAPLGERRATLEEMKAALPPDLRDLVEISDALHGDHVQADYTLDKDGLIKEIRLKCGKDARPETVALHEEVIRTMQKFQGFTGRLRLAINWVKESLGITPKTPNPEKRASFEAALEIQKLPSLIVKQMQRMRNMEPNARAEAEVELDHLQQQLIDNLHRLDYGEGTEAAGFVAAKGVAKAKRKKYAELLEKLRPLQAGSKPHKDLRWEIYELVGGDLPYHIWEKVYQSNVERANKANEIVAAEHERLGFGQTEQTVSAGKGEVRRLDIASLKSKRGIEVKAYESGKIYATEDIISEVERDAWLVKKGWDIKWILIDTEPSEPLREMLLAAGIRIEMRTRKGKTTELVGLILPPKKGKR